MNGAESLVRSLLDAGVDTCFANPGTSEMHFVAALDHVPGMRCVLGLFEGVVTGAADGYARMTDKSAATLLHCGPGLANGLANLHNARRAHAPVLNLIGDQATHQAPLDPPLTADTMAFAQGVSVWTRRATSADRVAADAMEGLRAAIEGPGVASLILPSDTCWDEGGVVAPALARGPRPQADAKALEVAERMLRNGRRTALMLAGAALREAPLELASRIAQATGAVVMAPTQVKRVQLGQGRLMPAKVPYAIDPALEMMAQFDQIILIGAKPPVQFFAYPGKPGVPYRADTVIHTVTRPGMDDLHALDVLAEALGVGAALPLPAAPDYGPISGAITAEAFAAGVAQLLPENAILVDEGVSFGRAVYPALAHAKPHDYLQLTGGAIGDGIPMATGAAVACPDRRVVDIQADGSGLYTVQGLWTQAREALNVTTVVLSNQRYAILEGELKAVGATQGKTATDMLTLDRPSIDWPSIAKGFGVPATRVEDMESFAKVFEAVNAEDGPHVIEVMI